MRNKRRVGWVIFIAVIIGLNLAAREGLIPFYVF